ncbi:hypothetical protein B0I35DRAFT_479510 [Stachybotrys elegans]|uniref:Uncharacterized protein n=1 Tax=Stachybotrys elegans TaxID=80388 RepID=A0A8K0SMB0_9HYPO|nr:hypothetical protein B0I35DRAFT_479510 [Stachybotrys elegans]
MRSSNMSIASTLALLLSIATPVFAAVPTSSCITSTSTEVLPTLSFTTLGATTTWTGQPITDGHRTVTVYTTAYEKFCSTGLTMHTYTVTEHCPPQPDCTCRGEIPKNFYKTVAVCDTCGKVPITATLTLPSPTPTPKIPSKDGGFECKHPEICNGSEHKPSHGGEYEPIPKPHGADQPHCKDGNCFVKDVKPAYDKEIPCTSGDCKSKDVKPAHDKEILCTSGDCSAKDFMSPPGISTLVPKPSPSTENQDYTDSTNGQRPVPNHPHKNPDIIDTYPTPLSPAHVPGSAGSRLSKSSASWAVACIAAAAITLVL